VGIAIVSLIAKVVVRGGDAAAHHHNTELRPAPDNRCAAQLGLTRRSAPRQ
jgi:hypothetical protein